MTREIHLPGPGGACAGGTAVVTWGRLAPSGAVEWCESTALAPLPPGQPLPGEPVFAIANPQLRPSEEQTDRLAQALADWALARAREKRRQEGTDGAGTALAPIGHHQ